MSLALLVRAVFRARLQPDPALHRRSLGVHYTAVNDYLSINFSVSLTTSYNCSYPVA